MKITLCTNIKYIERIYKLISSLESLLQVKMSRHDGVSCDSCLKNNFRGRRYKCLICYDYDLCASCYEEGATTTRHTAEHPMQCILTRSDFELYYGGEALNLEQPQAYTCPYCNRMGYTDNSLQEHVTSDHTDTSFEVVCPVCAALPGGDPNLVTEDFAGHLTLEHRTGPRDLISFLDEPSGIRHGGVRRVQHASRGVGSTRARRSNMHFSSSGGLSSLSPSSRDAVDPIAELLSQLSGVRRSAAAGTTGGNSGTTPSQLQQLHMQIQLERQQVSYLQAARQQLERLPRRQTQAGAAASQSAATAPREPQTQGTGGNSVANALLASSQALPNTGAAPCAANNSQFLLTRFMATSMSDTELAAVEQQRADRSLFAQSLALATLTLHEQEPEEEPEVPAPIANSNDSNESLNNSSPPVDKPNDVKKIGPPRDNQSPGNTKPKGSKPPPPADRKSKLNSNNKPRDLKSRGDTPKTRPEANQLSERR